MPLTTRNVSNVGDALTAPDGTVLAGKTIAFTLVTASGALTDVFDAITGERVVGKVTASTNATGEFTVALWPNDRGSIVTKYLCQVDVVGAIDFKASVASGGSTIQWIDFKAAGTPLVAIGGTGQFNSNSATTTGLTYGYSGGLIRNDSAVTTVADGTVLLTANLTNYVEVTGAGVVSANTTGFNAGSFPMATVLTGASTITTITDKRGFAVAIDLNAASIDVVARNVGISTVLEESLENTDAFLTSLKMTGFGAWTSGADATTYSIVDGKFQLNRAGFGYINGRKISWVAGQQTGVLAANTFYFVYIDAAGLIQTSTSYQANTIRIYEALFDGTIYFIGKENHPIEFETAISGYLHSAAGTIIFSTGANITRVGTGTGASTTDRQIKIVGADTLSDHGLNTTITDSAGAGVSIAQMYRNAAGKWIQYVDQIELAPFYNNAGTPTALNVTPNIFSVYVIYAKKDDINSSSPQYLAAMNETAYATLGEAQSAITAGAIVYETNELKAMEGAQLGYAIVQYSAAGGYITELQIAKASLTQQFIGAGVGASGNHALQSNLNYASAGHTGFASSVELNHIDNRPYTTTTTATLNLNYDSYNIARLTAQVGALTIANPTGALVDFDGLVYAINGNGAALAFGDQFVNRGATKPTVTVNGKWLFINCIRNATASTWDVVAVVTEA